jgi:hypothetical protein
MENVKRQVAIINGSGQVSAASWRCCLLLKAPKWSSELMLNLQKKPLGNKMQVEKQ